MSSNCYLCKTSTNKLAFSKLGYDIFKCRNCTLLSLDFPHKYQPFIKKYYNQNFFQGSPDRAGYADYEGDQTAELMNMKKYLQKIHKFKNNGKLLDVGCATGLFLNVAKKSNFDVYGFDISEYAVNLAKKRHPKKIKLASVDSANYQPNQFDVITMFDVIEHLKDPRKDLLKMKKFLKKDGFLVINTGDAQSYLAKIQGPSWHFFIPPQHLFFFSKTTITKLLNQTGFKVISIDYQGKWITLRYFLNLAKQIHHNQVAKFLYPHITKNSIGKLPIYLNLFDNIVICAKKNSASLH